GHPVSHSLSPAMHNAAISALDLDYIYVPFHVLPDDLAKAVDGIRSLGISGVNVTIPHKERIIEYLDEVSELSMMTGSVNTVVNRDDRLIGDTTDGRGFLKSAEAEWGKLDGMRVVVLGAGGSARAVCFALAQVGCEIVIANRTIERAGELVEGLKVAFGTEVARVVGMNGDALAEEVAKAGLLVNTTSVGMSPDVDGIPIPAGLLHPKLLVYDLIYNPLNTRLVLEARSRGAKAVSGLGMLACQGALSFEMWTGRQAPVQVMEEAVARVTQNSSL
ncbi:shikimate dehydrogenase, partial [bacterium]|nr:shikimate dehydrogenase [bacterium]